MPESRCLIYLLFLNYWATHMNVSFGLVLCCLLLQSRKHKFSSCLLIRLENQHLSSGVLFLFLGITIAHFLYDASTNSLNINLASDRNPRALPCPRYKIYLKILTTVCVVCIQRPTVLCVTCSFYFEICCLHASGVWVTLQCLSASSCDTGLYNSI